jgi:TRAP-type C4-dicarboxylate transport system permease small subunit
MASLLGAASQPLLLGGVAFLFIVILVFAVIGFQRGWRRELVSLGFTLGILFILSLGGGKGIASFVFNTLPQAISVVLGNTRAQSPNVQIRDGEPNLVAVEIITLAVAVALGYIIGNKAFGKPNTPPERLLGILPSIVSGYALVFFVTTHLVNANTQPTSPVVGISAPTQDTVGSSLVIIVVIAVVVVVAALIASSAKKSPGKK